MKHRGMKLKNEMARVKWNVLNIHQHFPAKENEKGFEDDNDVAYLSVLQSGGSNKQRPRHLWLQTRIEEQPAEPLPLM